MNPSAEPNSLVRVSLVEKIPRLALTKREVAESLGVSVDFVADHVWHQLALVRRGRKTLCPVAELQRWLEREASRV
jgi:Helix-turn-helix domain